MYLIDIQVDRFERQTKCNVLPMLYLLKKQTLNLLKVKRLKIIPVVPVGLEPTTPTLRVSCSPNIKRLCLSMQPTELENNHM